MSPGTLLGGMLDPGSGAMRVKPWYLVRRKFGPWYLVRWRLEPGTWRGAGLEGRTLVPGWTECWTWYLVRWRLNLDTWLGRRSDPGTWCDKCWALVPGWVEGWTLVPGGVEGWILVSTYTSPGTRPWYLVWWKVEPWYLVGEGVRVELTFGDSVSIRLGVQRPSEPSNYFFIWGLLSFQFLNQETMKKYYKQLFLRWPMKL